MFRAGLAVYFSLMLVANPSVCCCVSARLTDCLATFGVGTVQKQGHSLPSCCRQPSPGNGATPAVPPIPARPNPAEKTPCPIHAGCFHDLAKSVDQAGLTALHHASHFDLEGLESGLLCSFDFPLFSVRSSPFWNAGAPRLTAEDLLRAHHNLRC
jgi:hypothetical protein